MPHTRCVLYITKRYAILLHHSNSFATSASLHTHSHKRLLKFTGLMYKGNNLHIQTHTYFSLIQIF